MVGNVGSRLGQGHPPPPCPLETLTGQEAKRGLSRRWGDGKCFYCLAGGRGARRPRLFLQAGWSPGTDRQTDAGLQHGRAAATKGSNSKSRWFRPPQKIPESLRAAVSPLLCNRSLSAGSGPVPAAVAGAAVARPSEALGWEAAGKHSPKGEERKKKGKKVFFP